MARAGQVVQRSLGLMVTTQNMAGAAEALEVVALSGGLLVARLSMVLVAVLEGMVRVMEESGAVSHTHIPHLLVLVLEPLERLEILVAAMAVALEQKEEMEEPLVAAEAEAELVAQKQGVSEPEARCEYGLGSSEQRRTQRPGCAEA